MRACCILVCAALAAGCYSFTPVTLEQVQPGTEVRVFLSSESGQGAPRSEDAAFMDGLVLEADAARLVLGRRWSDPALATRTGSPRERLPLDVADILFIQVKELDRMRTGLLVGAVALGTAYVVRAMLRGGGSAGEPPDGGNGTF